MPQGIVLSAWAGVTNYIRNSRGLCSDAAPAEAGHSPGLELQGVPGAAA